MEAQKFLDGKVACMGEGGKHAKLQPKISLYGGGLVLNKPISVESQVKSYLVVIFVKGLIPCMPIPQVWYFSQVLGHI